MRLEKLSLVNFKNYEKANVTFQGGIHCFLGRNGSGKTNLLEAIHYLSLTRGKFHSHDLSNIRHGHDHFSISGSFEKNGRVAEVACMFSTGNKKSMFENGKEYTRFSDHIGKYPLVLVAPNDGELVTEGGEVRRKFFDTLLSQVDKEYLEHLISYQANLRQRNSLLRIFSERGSIDHDLIDSYDEKLVASGAILFAKRREFVNGFLPLLGARYNFLAMGRAELAGLDYNSELERLEFKNELKGNLSRDIILGRTTVGIHRDDFTFSINGNELKRYGSQGQQKSFLISLKLAEYDYLSSHTGTKPLVLLDDIFDKLDDDRIHQLLTLMMVKDFGQIFITDARPGRSLEVMKAAGVKSQNFSVEDGTLATWK